MNRTKSIALFAGIFAIAMTTYGLSGFSTSSMAMASIPQTQDAMGMLGHVEYTVLDSSDTVKAYLQTDNIVVRTGTDCAGETVFGTTNSATCTGTGTTFRYIGIGNGTQGVAATDTSLAGNQCAINQAGELARKLVTPTQVDNSGSGTVVTLDVLTNTFKFDASNATTVKQSALFNDDVAAASTTTGSCTTLGAAGTDWNMFSIQDLSGGGVVVSSGDSLAVKWTITIS